MVQFTDLWLQSSTSSRCNFALDKPQKIMKQETDFFEKLCMDEAICFIADRHHVTPQQLLRYFLSHEIPIKVDGSVKTTIPLESNEIEILKGLFGTINN